jgi:hypothetical protein
MAPTRNKLVVKTTNSSTRLFVRVDDRVSKSLEVKKNPVVLKSLFIKLEK